MSVIAVAVVIEVAVTNVQVSVMQQDAVDGGSHCDS